MINNQKTFYSEKLNRVVIVIPVGIITTIFSQLIIKRVFMKHSANTLVYSDALIPFSISIIILAIITIAYLILDRMQFLQSTALRVISQILLGSAATLTGVNIFLVLFTIFASLPCCEQFF